MVAESLSAFQAHHVLKTRAEQINGMLRALKEFEEQYHIDSEQMLSAVSSGELVETADVGRWMIIYSSYKKLIER